MLAAAVQAGTCAAIVPGFHNSDTLQAEDGRMNRDKNLIDVKQALSDKYTHLASLAGSEPKRKTLIHKATKYRRQVEQLRRDGVR